MKIGAKAPNMSIDAANHLEATNYNSSTRHLTVEFLMNLWLSPYNHGHSLRTKTHESTLHQLSSIKALFCAPASGFRVAGCKVVCGKASVVVDVWVITYL